MKNKIKKNIAKKDFVICQNEYYIVIKKDDDIDSLNIPDVFTANLIKENVI
jgi:hypothetical protein